MVATTQLKEVAMATQFLQQVQSVMEGVFMHDPMLTEIVGFHLR